MIFIRPIWARNSAVAAGGQATQVTTLLELEKRAIQQIELTLNAVAKVADDDEKVDAVRPLVTSACTDLVAGAELARAGYFKQAYSLWRAWYEQTLFALYFVEAPLHRAAWRQVTRIEPGKEPPLKLMLHQVLVEEGDKAHAFAVVYAERFLALFNSIALSTPPKDLRPIKLAERRLTDFSQGVHGTYQPVPVRADAELPSALDEHVIPLLRATVRLIGIFGFVCVQSQLSFSAEQLVRMRDRAFVPTSDNDDESLIAPLLPQLWDWLEELRELEVQKSRKKS